MVSGESGLLACSPPWFMPDYQPSNRLLVWPNGSMAQTYSADEPNLLRGPQFHYAWGDEPASWRFWEAHSNLEFTLRLGRRPEKVYTTTPKGGIAGEHIKELLAQPGTITNVGDRSSYANRANLPPSFFDTVLSHYVGTRIGQQEIFALLLADAMGALWRRAMIDVARVKEPPALERVVVAVDPPAKKTGAECGIVVAGKDFKDHGYILDDMSLHGSPAEWGKAVVEAYHRHKADRVVVEVNNGGDMVEHTIRTIQADPKLGTPAGKDIPITAVHASRGKATRAEPVVAKYEQHLIHHVGLLPALEDQQCQWEPNSGDPSPDRVDALVWALSALLITRQPSEVVGFS
jgi:phage terminase large subunit-like protein